MCVWVWTHFHEFWGILCMTSKHRTAGGNMRIRFVQHQTLWLGPYSRLWQGTGHFESDMGRSVKLLTKLYRNYWHTPQVMLTVMFVLFQDTNVRGLFKMCFLIQPSCVPLSLGYRTAHVPCCPQDVNSQLHYQPANYCSCRLQYCTPLCQHQISNDSCTVTLCEEPDPVHCGTLTIYLPKQCTCRAN